MKIVKVEAVYKGSEEAIRELYIELNRLVDVEQVGRDVWCSGDYGMNIVHEQNEVDYLPAMGDVFSIRWKSLVKAPAEVEHTFVKGLTRYGVELEATFEASETPYEKEDLRGYSFTGGIFNKHEPTEGTIEERKRNFYKQVADKRERQRLWDTPEGIKELLAR